VNLILFDFDGTIADSFDVILHITNRLAKEFGYEPASPAQIKQLQNLNSREIIKHLQIPVYKLPFLLRRLKSEMNQEIHSLDPIPGVKAVLEQIHQQGYRLGIVTSNTESNVRIFLQRHGMEALFELLHGEVMLFGKARVLTQVLRRQSLSVASVVYVGDETRDVEAAKKVGMKVVAVDWGFNSHHALQDVEPDALVSNPMDLLGAIARLSPPSSPLG
jgi:phosphoglycolate phosphatase-like HAD superfamily hydrolase